MNALVSHAFLECLSYTAAVSSHYNRQRQYVLTLTADYQQSCRGPLQRRRTCHDGTKATELRQAAPWSTAVQIQVT